MYDDKLLRESIRQILHEADESSETVTDLAPHKKGEEVVVDRGNEDYMSKIVDSLIDMFKLSYADLGGLDSIETPAGLKSKFTHFFVTDIDEDPEPDAGIYFSDRGGSRKASVTATDGSPAARAKVREMMLHFFTQPGSWAEVSGKPANIMLSKLGLPTVESEQEIRALLGKVPQEDIVFEGKHPDSSISYGYGWYTRTIRGHRETKIIVGNP